MAIYDIDGNQLTHAYDVDGNEVQSAYDVDGNLIFTAEPTVISVMSYNVGGWYNGSGTNVPQAKDAEYYALQNAIINSNDADILCLEEYWDVFSETGRTALSLLEQYYPYIHTEGGTTQYYGRAICSKYPIESYQTNIYSEGDYHRYFDKATINVDGTRLNVIVTHWGLTEAKRQIEATQLYNYVQNMSNVIICGDLNMIIEDGTETEYVNNIQPFVNEGFNLANWGDFGFLKTYYASSYPNGLCLDQIMTSSNLAITSVSVDETKLNDQISDTIDHIPLIAEITI